MEKLAGQIDFILSTEKFNTYLSKKLHILRDLILFRRSRNFINQIG